jgi:hypothetical protein
VGGGEGTLMGMRNSGDGGKLSGYLLGKLDRCAQPSTWKCIPDACILNISLQELFHMYPRQMVFNSKIIYSLMRKYHFIALINFFY